MKPLKTVPWVPCTGITPLKRGVNETLSAKAQRNRVEWSCSHATSAPELPLP